MLSVPDKSTHRSKLADWLELVAISSPDGRIGFNTLVAATALTENEQEMDVADEDSEDDQLVLAVQEEIDRRRTNLGDDYPFRVDDTGRAMQYVTPVTKVGYIYLFCLFLSHASDRTIVSEALAPAVSNKTRDLFQVCATLAAGGYVTGPAVSFGFPRPEGEEFLKALRRVYKAFGDGRPRRKPRPAAPKKVKDDGIDVIAWRRSIDALPGTIYVVGQVASGENWEGKSVIPDRMHFHAYWFTKQPSSQAQDAMFIPFCLEPEIPVDGTPYVKVLKDYMQSVGHRYGNLFYRDRISKYSGVALALIASGEDGIERYEELSEVVSWVDEYTERLRAQ